MALLADRVPEIVAAREHQGAAAEGPLEYLRGRRRSGQPVQQNGQARFDDPRGQLLFIFDHGIHDRAIWLEASVSEYLSAHPVRSYLWVSTSQIASLLLALTTGWCLENRLKRQPHGPGREGMTPPY